MAPNQRRTAVIAAAGVVFTIYFAYLLYGLETGTGVAGYLMDLQLQWFGSFGMKATLLLGSIPVLLLGALLAPVAGRRPVPFEEGPNGHVVPFVVSEMPWKIWLPLSLAPVAIATPLYLALHAGAPRPSATSLAVDLSEGKGGPLGEGEADVTGLFAPGRCYELTDSFVTRRSTSYAPLAAHGWTPAVPVRVVVREELEETPQPYRSSGGMGCEGHPRGPITLRGELARKTLPVYVVTAFAKQGVTLDPDYEVLTPDGAGPFLDDASKILMGGGVLTVIGLLTLLVTTLQKLNKKGPVNGQIAIRRDWLTRGDRIGFREPNGAVLPLTLARGARSSVRLRFQRKSAGDVIVRVWIV